MGQANESPPIPPKTSLHPEKMMLHSVDCQGSLIKSPSRKPNGHFSNKYCSQLGQLKAALNRKKLVNRKAGSPIRITQTDTFFDDQAKSVTAWLKVLIHLPYYPLHLPISFILFFTKFLFNRKNFNSLNTL